MKSLGVTFTVELRQCKSLLGHRETEKLVLQSIKELGQKMIFHFFEPSGKSGTTGVVQTSELRLTVDIWPDSSCVYLTIFARDKAFDPAEILNRLFGIFTSEHRLYGETKVGCTQ